MCWEAGAGSHQGSDVAASRQGVHLAICRRECGHMLAGAPYGLVGGIAARSAHAVPAPVPLA